MTPGNPHPITGAVKVIGRYKSLALLAAHFCILFLVTNLVTTRVLDGVPADPIDMRAYRGVDALSGLLDGVHPGPAPCQDLIRQMAARMAQP